MNKQTRLFLVMLIVAAFLFGTIKVAFSMERRWRGGAGDAAKVFQENSVAADVYQHGEKDDFKDKTRTHDEGDELQVGMEQGSEWGIAEGEDGEFEDGEFGDGEVGDGEVGDGEFTESGAKGLAKRIAELEKKLAEDPNNTKLLWKLVVAYRNAAEYDKAIAVLRELQKQLPHPTAKVTVLLAQCLRAKGDREAALAELGKLLESPATVPGAVYAYEGILKEELGKVEEATEDMENAITTEPKAEDLYKKVGELYKKADKKGIKVFVKGRKLSSDAEPFVENGRTMVPVRAIAQALGLKVDYDGKKDVVVISNPDSSKTLVLYLGRAEAMVDGQKMALDMPARVVPPGRMVVPLRFVSENLGADVKWFEEGQVVAVNEQ
ncbi:stalk domain-containing protein [Gelria sp. Kuro-4]|uniref:stalk domain-containing protein n=1 Tax=Gelria sp. Kuro-4 TaxID=2796927 RepID=UPI001BF12385|nr:stalk domain-containing protein [Gelria sp. Kuro-4]BCV24249.1 hypothetical protein kuro4_10220 [Gelria sp. Kuro-4]